MSGLYNIYSNKKYIDKSENSLDLLNLIFSGLDQKISKLNNNLSSPETQKRINEFVGSLDEKIRENFSPIYSQPPTTNYQPQEPPKKKKRHNPEITPEDRAAFERMKVPLDLPQRFVRPPKIPGY